MRLLRMRNRAVGARREERGAGRGLGERVPSPSAVRGSVLRGSRARIDRLSCEAASVGFRVVDATRILTRGGCFAPETSVGFLLWAPSSHDSGFSQLWAQARRASR